MSQCTCTTDKEMTCIVHPTDRAMKELIAAMQARNEELELALREAADDMEGWGRYAGDYYMEKYDLDGDVAKYKRIANRESGALQIRHSQRGD